MYNFETPGPIGITVTLEVGELQIVASDRQDAQVEVRPADNRDASVKAAEQTRVELENGRLTVIAPKSKPVSLKKPGALQVVLGVPTGSSVQAESAVGDLRSKGKFGDFRFKTSQGDIAVDEADNLSLEAALGTISVGRASGDVVAKVASGEIRIGEVIRGTASLDASKGGIEVGINRGTAVELDVQSMVGATKTAVDGLLEQASGETVKVRARTAVGDITVRRNA